MEQFIAVAAAHFVALLIPGVDFFLIARTAMTSGWRTATGVCLGVVLANGVLIAAAFSGMSLITQPLLLTAIQACGGSFVVFIGVAIFRSQARFDIDQAPQLRRSTWLKNLGLGLTSGLLNPKNALFYVSLAAAVGANSPTTLMLYGLWMFSIILVWDVFVAVGFGSRHALVRMGRIVPWLTRIAGGFLVVFLAGMLVSLAVQHFG